METLKNLTLVQWIGIMIGLNSLLMGATPQLTVLFGTAAVPIIVAVATLGNGALGVFVTVIGGLGNQARNVVAGGASIAVGPNASASLATLAMDPAQSKIDAAPGAGAAVAAIAKAAASVLFAIFAIGLMFSQSASAQTAKKLNLPIDPLGLNGTAVTGKPSQDLIALYTKLQAVSKVDLQYALNIANKKNNVAAGQCWTAIISQIDQDQSANLGADGQPLPTPDPHLFTDVERLSDVINSLGPNSPLMVGCGSFANQAKMNVLQLISTILAGGAGLAAFAP